MIEFFRTISDTVGIIGVSCILIAYFLVNTNRINPNKSVLYLSLNFVGAWLILFSLFFHWNLASVLIEFAWIIISLVGFYRLLRTKKTPPLTMIKRNNMKVIN